jgi:hypothetical protein
MGTMKPAIEWAEHFSVYHPLMDGQANEYDIMILDPDGWSRKNFKEDFCETGISEEAFFDKLKRSTVRGEPSDIKELFN